MGSIGKVDSVPQPNGNAVVQTINTKSKPIKT